MMSLVAYSLGGYLAYNHVRIKETILRIAVSVSPKQSIRQVDDLVLLYTSHSDMLVHTFELTTCTLGSYGILSVRVDKKPVSEQDGVIEFSVFVKHRSSLEWSIKAFSDRLKHCLITCSVIKRK